MPVNNTTTATIRPRTYITVDGEKKQVTRYLVMQYAVAALEANESTPVEILNKAKEMLDALKPATGITLTATKNAHDGAAFIVGKESGYEFTLKDVCVALNIPDMPDGRVATQKATPIVTMLVNSGSVIKIGGRPTKYRVI